MPYIKIQLHIFIFVNECFSQVTILPYLVLETYIYIATVANMCGNRPHLYCASSKKKKCVLWSPSMQAVYFQWVQGCLIGNNCKFNLQITWTERWKT